ncbi:MAG: 50S ribosomal protein L21 [Melioribacteraceae bacterium]
MYAVVDIAGQQFQVEENSMYYVPKLDTEVSKTVTFDNVLLYSDGKTTSIGTPSVKGMKVQAKVFEHIKDDKVIVFKKIRRKSYKKKNGHRQQLSRIEITKISKSTAKAPAKKVEEKKVSTETKTAKAKVTTKAKETVKTVKATKGKETK